MVFEVLRPAALEVQGGEHKGADDVLFLVLVTQCVQFVAIHQARHLEPVCPFLAVYYTKNQKTPTISAP